MVSSLLRYVLAQDIAVTIPGLRSINKVEIAADVGEKFNELTQNEKARFNFRLGKVTTVIVDFVCLAPKTWT